MYPSDFASNFTALTGNKRFPWQARLFQRFIQPDRAAPGPAGERFPPCSLPTGLGKTSVMAVWLLALAETANGDPPSGGVPRRLAYVVNRRTIVDQATREAEIIRQKLEEPALAEVRRRLMHLCRPAAALAPCPPSGPNDQAPPILAISTLRGQFADNGEWAADPARPAIIVGTVDMIGSRLLFSGYGVGYKRKPLHAGFLGQDTLLVHDEAHLEPAFQQLLDTIRKEQTEGRCPDFRRLHVMPLTATPRTGNGQKPFELEEEDFKHPEIGKRLNATKIIKLHPLDDEKTADKVAALAIERAEDKPGSAILVFVRKVDDVKKIVDALGKAKGVDKDKQIEQLTGTLRGKERDELVRKPVFQRFLPPWNRDSTVALAEGTVFLVCTSAGEVGVDISADHLVCDLTTFDSMAQRFGRVNRYGDGAAIIDVVHPKSFSESGANKDYEACRERTLELLNALDKDGSPKALMEIPPGERIAAFSPKPKFLNATDILFDAWALTTIREKMPGRPPVADWLHGVPTEWQPPETRVAWREEVQWITGELLEEYEPEDLLEVYPLKPHELLKDRSSRVFEELKQIAKRYDGDDGSTIPVWSVDDRSVEVTTLQRIVERDEDAIANRTVILPPFAGGLSGGMLDGKSRSADDVADEWFDENERQRRKRVWDTDTAPPGMRAVRSAIDIAPNADEAAETEPVEHKEAAEEEEDARVDVLPRRPGSVWTWYAIPRSADDDGSRTANAAVKLDVHIRDVHENVRRIVNSLGLAETSEGRALVFAAKAHDLGKDRGIWQRSIRNMEYPQEKLAKSGHRRPPLELSNYRHEFGSLLDILTPAGLTGDLATQWANLNELERDLALHFIAAHHGRGRPHFPANEAFDPAPGRILLAATVARDTPRRFARLQQKYGRWGLAYLESILRAADVAASIEPSETVNEEKGDALTTVEAGDVR